jgi:hypothetical protein
VTSETLTGLERAHIANALSTAGEPLTPFGDAVAKALRVLDAQTRYAALIILRWNDAEGISPPDDMPAGVAEVVREYFGCEIRDCHDCGARNVPVKHKPERHYMFREFVCAWGCGG